MQLVKIVSNAFKKTMKHLLSNTVLLVKILKLGIELTRSSHAYDLHQGFFSEVFDVHNRCP